MSEPEQTLGHVPADVEPADHEPADHEPADHEPADDDLRALLARRQHAKPNRTTWILLALLAVAIGFVLGSCTQRAVSTFNDRMAPPPANESTAVPGEASGS